MSSALSITRAVNPPRSVFLDFPLGHTAGKADDIPLQRKVMIDTLSALDSIQVPGTIRTLSYRWADNDNWKDGVMRAENTGSHTDNRVERRDGPQYQLPTDETAAELALAADGCPTCFDPEQV